MTQLFIEGTEVLLPEDFSVDYIIENPFFTRRGEYTYDIDIDLRILKNRKIYQFAGRADAVKRPRNREALLLCDGVIIVRGTEILLSIDDDIAKIQIVSGNSELNYIAKGDLKLRDLDFGTVELNNSVAKSSTYGCYPSSDFVCAPIARDSQGGQISYMVNQVVPNENGFDFSPDANLIAQPYLLYILEKLLEIIGYTIEENELRNDARWSRLIIVNGIKTNKFAEMLPDWTVDDFIDEVEKFFNCIIFVNQFKKSVIIRSLDKFYANYKKVYIDNILDDSVEKSYDSKESLAISYDNVRYDFPDNNGYRYMRIADDVKKVLEVVDRVNYYDNWNELQQTVAEKKLIHCLDYDFHAIAKLSIDNQYRLIPVDQFKEISVDNSDNIAELKMIPAYQMAPNVDFRISGSHYYGSYFCCYANNVNPMDEKDNELSLEEIIEQGVPERKAPEKMFIGLYLGVKKIYSLSMKEPSKTILKGSVPMTAVDTIEFHIGWHDILGDGHRQAIASLLVNPNKSMTLRLDGPNGLYNNYYKRSIDVDTSTEYEFDFVSNSIPDQRSIFVIANKMYFCKRLTTRIFASGRDKVIHGNFYLMT